MKGRAGKIKNTARAVALTALLRAEEDGAYITLVAPLGAEQLEDIRDRRLAVALAYGVTERRITLDYVAGRLLARSIRELEAHTRALLRLALYQLMYMTRTPAYAVVNETVSMGRHAGERSLLNAVLRRAANDISALFILPEREKDALRYLSVRYALPLPLVRLFVKEFGEERAESLAASFLVRPPLTLRVNNCRTSQAEMEGALTAGGYSPKAVEDLSDCLLLDGSAVPEELPGFSEGHFFVQDIASQRAVRALQPKAGMRILDVCACPGGKTFSAFCLADGQAEVFAADLHESKLPLLKGMAKRLGFQPVLVTVRDATEKPPVEWGMFDRIICDVPCSGWGVLRKKPDLRHRQQTDIDALPPLQLDILQASASALAEDGQIMYSTCTLRSAENGDVVREFLAENDGFSLLEERTFYPDRDDCDGFYYAILQKKKV